MEKSTDDYYAKKLLVEGSKRQDKLDNEIKVIKNKILHILLRISQFFLILILVFCVTIVAWRFTTLLNSIEELKKENKEILNKINIIKIEEDNLQNLFKNELYRQNELNQLLNKKLNK